jgi:hypothetical protein
MSRTTSTHAARSAGHRTGRAGYRCPQGAAHWFFQAITLANRAATGWLMGPARDRPSLAAARLHSRRRKSKDNIVRPCYTTSRSSTHTAKPHTAKRHTARPPRTTSRNPTRCRRAAAPASHRTEPRTAAPCTAEARHRPAWPGRPHRPVPASRSPERRHRWPRGPVGTSTARTATNTRQTDTNFAGTGSNCSPRWWPSTSSRPAKSMLFSCSLVPGVSSPGNTAWGRSVRRPILT